jgi:hypothetical protein
VKTEEVSRTIIGTAMRARLLAPETRKWLTIAAVTFGLFILDNTIVNVALPSIQRDLGSTVSQLEGVVERRSRR